MNTLIWNLTRPVSLGKSLGVILLLLFFAIDTTQAQTTLPFTNFSVNDGLPSSEVYHVMQDSRGFMWFSTDHGVSRYDGYQFKTYTTADGLADNTIFECIEDYKGRIWFRSFSGKLSYFYHDSIYRLCSNEELVKTLRQSHITSLMVDSSDNLYIATQLLQGIIKIDLTHSDKISFTTIEQKTSYLLFNSARNTPILGNTLGTTSVSEDTSSFLNSYHLKPHDTIPILTDKIFIKNGNNFPLLWYCNSILLPNGNLALSYGKDLLILNGSRIQFSYHFKDYIIRLGDANNGALWISLKNSEPLYYFEGKVQYQPVIKVLKDKQITSILTDREGGIWCTSLTKGVYYLSSLDFTVRTDENGLPANKISNLEVAPDSTLWISTSPGNTLTIIKNDSLCYKTIKEFNKSTTINSILFHNDNTVWVGCGEKLNIFKNTIDFPVIKANYTHGIKDMYLMQDNLVWVNCRINAKLLKNDNDSLKILKSVSINTRIEKLVPQNYKTLWIAGMNGLWKYTNDSIIYLGTNYPALRKRIDDIALSSNGDLWVATRDSGLIIVGKNKISYLNTSNGLVSNFSHCLTFDYKGNIWVGTNTGLSHVILHYDKNRNYIIDSVKNIVSSNLKEINCIATINNMVYAGTNNGLVSFDMNKMGVDKTPPPIYITGFKTGNVTIPVMQKRIILNYDENNIVINYVGLTFRDASNTLYRYKMKGIDTGWVYTEYLAVQYPKLPPGNYSFLVSARNSDGVWSKENASISFIITPPFWATWWFRFIIVSIIILLVYWRIKVVTKRERLKAEATQKLTEMELRELREQLDPHFLFNNLNTLSYLVESKSQDAPLFVEELSKYFRYSLQFRHIEFTELKNEIQQAKRYIHILKIRFGERLLVNWDIDENRMDYFISNHSLQLLLENIIKHNVASFESPLIVEIRTTSEDSLSVKNNLQPKLGHIESTGLGLKSINDRYNLLYRKKIKIKRSSDSFYVELPLITPDEHESLSTQYSS